MGLGKYLKKAFVNRWNQLLLWGGVAFAFVSGRPDIALPLVVAAEAAYLGFAGTHPRFQTYVDAQEAASRREGQARKTGVTLKKILRSLPRESYKRFEALRNRCLELREIAHDLKAPDPAGSGVLDSMQHADLDRLLWIYLRLLFTQYSLKRFLQRTKVGSIQNDVRALEQRLHGFDQVEPTPHQQRIRKSLEDSLATSRDRLSNYEKAESNHELVNLEISRLEAKIQSLAERSVNRQDHDFISREVDQVAESMLETEKTMADLDFATGLGQVDDEVPQLMSPRVEVVN